MEGYPARVQWRRLNPRVTTPEAGTGNVSQSHSNASGPWKDQGPELGTPHHCGVCYLPLPIAGALDTSLEDLLTGADKLVDVFEAFVGMISASVARMEEQVAKGRPSWGLCPVHSGNSYTQFTCPPSSVRRSRGPGRPATQPPSCFRLKTTSLLQWETWDSLPDGSAGGCRLGLPVFSQLKTLLLDIHHVGV